MKTPEEKAEELIDKYEDILGHSDLNVCYTGDLNEETTYTAKQCAKFCCEEIIKAIPKQVGGKVRFANPDYDFYLKVKQIIEEKDQKQYWFDEFGNKICKNCD